VLAIEPSAALSWWEERDGDAGYDLVDGVAVVRIDGALTRSSNWWAESYENISHRFEAALADPQARAVAMRIRSPGGAASGNTEAVRAMRETKIRASKPVLAWADGVATSAAYCLACVADGIYVDASSRVGSVGTIAIRYDTSSALEEAGVRVALVASGAQKLDGYAEAPLTDEERARMRETVTYLAQLFAAEVAIARGMTVEDVLALEAAAPMGPAAVAARLADGVMGWDDVLALARAKGAEKMQIGALRAALALAATASDDEVLAAAVPLVELGLKTVELAGAKSADEAAGTIGAWQVSHAKLAERLVADAARAEQERAAAVEREKTERVELVKGAVLAGKLTPAQAFADVEQRDIKPAYAEMRIETLRAHVATLPVLALATTAEAKAQPSTAAASLTPDELAHCERTKTDPAKFAETKAKLYGTRAGAAA
jgi:ClpP class serine protease